jgi:hypothetical protein
MNKSESIINLVKATIKVMAEVKGIDKAMTIGEGKNAYKGVSDQDVKKTVGDAMEKNGLAIFPINIDDDTQLSSWEEVDQWSKATPKEIKRKQSIFTKVKVTYLLTHESGEFIEIQGFGHGVDSQDKSAGKATTYALKYALLYTFMVPTGKIDDADNTKPISEPQKPLPEKKLVKLTDAKFADAVKFLKGGKKMADLQSFYEVDEDMRFKLTLALETPA